MNNNNKYRSKDLKRRKMMRKTAKTIVLLTMIFVMAISVGMMAMGCEIGGGGDGSSSSKTIYYQYNDNDKTLTTGFVLKETSGRIVKIRVVD